ncbi:MAG: NAD(P)/FAD-dependent oxidoreductase [Aquabacterium sp.]|nr:NAD(P)/FAD-dependent oxidoreductase [Aquabacterium sp.]
MQTNKDVPLAADELEVLIIGAGFGGLGAAIKLKQAGIHRFLVIERAQDVGGTWRDNQYPGAACDIPSKLYSYSFAPNPLWSRIYSGSKEILAYIHHVVQTYKLEPVLRFGQEVSGMTFDEAAGLWTVSTQAGATFKARSVIMATGGLANPNTPRINGIGSFAGKVIHSARWDHDYDFTGKRVGVIGTGASAVQIVPELVKRAGFVKVFQRTPAWVLPRANFAIPAWGQKIYGKSNGAYGAARGALYWLHEVMALALVWHSPLTHLVENRASAHLKRQVKEPWLRRQLTPNFRVGCKRVLISNAYYPALQKPNCKLLTWPIDRIVPGGLRTVEGVEHQLDCLVLATGFDAPKNSTPFPITGLNGRVLADEWKQGAQAYKSMTVSGYPNVFFILGPNSGPGHNSALFYIEQQIGYAVQGIQARLKSGCKFLDVRPEIQKAHNQELQARLSKTNWQSGCKSWYLTDEGFNATMFPGFATQYAKQLKQFNAQHYSSR